MKCCKCCRFCLFLLCFFLSFFNLWCGPWLRLTKLLHSRLECFTEIKGFFFSEKKTFFLISLNVETKTYLGPQALDGRVLWVRVCPSVLLPFCLTFSLCGRFHGIGSLVFFNFGMVWETHMSCAWQTQIFWKHCFCPQNGPKWTKNRSFFKLLQNLLINSFSVWCIMKFLSFTIFLCKFHIWEKSGSWYIGRNADSQSDCKIFNYISRTRQQNGNFAFSIVIQIHDNSKLIENIFGWAWSKMGVTTLVPGL